MPQRQVKESVQTAENKTPETSKEIARINDEKGLDDTKQVQTDYYNNLHGIAEDVHPFSLADNHINDAKEVKEKLDNVF